MYLCTKYTFWALKAVTRHDFSMLSCWFHIEYPFVKNFTETYYEKYLKEWYGRERLMGMFSEFKKTPPPPQDVGGSMEIYMYMDFFNIGF